VVAAATLAVLVPLGLVATARLARRIVAVERHVATIARGRFGEQLADLGAVGEVARDDIGRLVAGVNHLSAALADLRTNLVAGERQRLLGQLAAGFAHELRNAVTGAQLAIDLHRRRCPSDDPRDESLAVATRQLAILEEEVRGLLALGRPGEAVTGPVDVAALVGEIRDLTGPRCVHAGVTLETEVLFLPLSASIHVAASLGIHHPPSRRSCTGICVIIIPDRPVILGRKLKNARKNPGQRSKK
jgi:signal transduction histidine kinase